MARKKATPEAPAANDTAPNASTAHPWFPDTDAGKIAKLVVKRLAYEDRKGLPGAGTTVKATLTPEPLPPPALTSERQIAETWGPGQYEVWALDAANRFACGAPYPVTIADERGQVPRYVRQFEAEDDGAELAGGMTETEKVLRLQLDDERRRRADERTMYEGFVRNQREHYEAALKAQREAHTADYASLGSLLDKMLQVVVPPKTDEGGASSWVMKRLEKIEAQADKAREENLELAVRNARRASHGGSEGEGVDWFGKALEVLPQVLPEVKGYLEERNALARERLELDRAKLQRRGTTLNGVTVPSLDELRDQLARGWRPKGDALAAFQALDRDGMLPRAYADLLAPFLHPSGGLPGGAPGGADPDRRAVGG